MCLLREAVRDFTMTAKTFDLLAGGMYGVQLNGIDFVLVPIAVTVKANAVGNTALRTGLFDVTRTFARGRVGRELIVVYLDKTPPNNFVGHVVTVAAAGLRTGGFPAAALCKMADITDLRVDLKMLAPFKVTMAGPAGDFDSLENLGHMPLVGELKTAIVYVLGQKLFTAVTVGSQTRDILYAGIWLGAHTSKNVINQMRRGDHLALHIVDQTRLEMALKAIDAVVG
jgi:hypothetical protein